MANALIRRATLLVTMNNKIIGYDALKEDYTDNGDFKELWLACKTKATHRMIFIYSIVRVCLDCQIISNNILFAL